MNQFSDEAKKNADTIIFYKSENAINGSSVKKFMEIAENSGITDFREFLGTNIVIGSSESIFEKLDFDDFQKFDN